MASCSLVLDYIGNNKKCERLDLDEFTTVANVLMQDRNEIVLRACKEELMGKPFSSWIDVIEKNSSTVHLSDKNSIQEAINEFISKYGPVDAPFSKNLIEYRSPLALVIHEAKNKANNKQFGAAQYCVGLARKSEK